MKSQKFQLAIVALLLPLFFASAKALPPDECLIMAGPYFELDSIWNGGNEAWEYYERENPDSVLVDTCKNSPTCGDYFAKYRFRILFNKGYYPLDNILDTNEVASISQISNSKPELQQQFQQLEGMFGTIYLSGIDSTVPDTTYYDSTYVYLYFEDYQNIDTVTKYVLQIVDSLHHIHYVSRLKNAVLVGVADKTREPFSIYPNPAKETIRIDIAFSPQNKTMQIINTNGQLMQELQYSDEINISDLPRGSYFLIYGNHIGKFIKE